ncbi:MAG: hypothetical protein DRH90_09365 [Deltaproteobacteria bacterium]|nr:MAG: hypothetical protein DRH90_09365 [Deltaproteobacteria bacterium]RLC18860.1 MAG: hypothetical protein DRI24_01790 [Deltaproteobacteria bacterium]HHE74270.1 hypothetical protein [Desulfobacteraceae bacterium]
MLLDHTHFRLNSEVTAIGGEYAFLKEGTVRFQEKTILYYVGCAVLNSTCCGTGGVCFARVPGVVHDLKYKTDDSGAPISRVEPIIEKTVQKQIRKILQNMEMVHQVEF